MNNMKIIKSVLALAVGAALLGLVGCSSTAPQNAIKGEMPDAFKTASGSVVLAKSLWWKELKDERLNALVEKAGSSNSDIRIAAAQLLQAEATLRGSEASFFPAFDLALKNSRDKQATGISEGDYPVLDTKKAQVAMNYEVDLWGRIASIRDSSEAALKASEQDKRSIELTVASSVVQGYLKVRQLDEQVATLKLIKDNNEKSLAVLEFSAREGYATEDAIERSKVELASAIAKIEQYHEQREKAVSALSILVGDPLLSIESDKDYKLNGLTAPAAGLPSSLLASRPDLLKAEHDLEAANANIDVAKKAFFPQISLTGALGSQSGQLNSLMRSGTGIWSFGFGLELPIFDGGLRMSNLMRSEADQQVAIAKYQKSIQVAFAEVNDALVSVESSRKVYEQDKSAVASAAKTLGLVTDRYKEGYSTYQDTLTEANNMHESRLAEIEGRYLVATNVAAFNRSLGY